MNFSNRTVWQRLRYIINLPQSVKLVWHLLWDKRVPAANKGLFVAIVALYVLVPTDIIPDFIPFIGEIDDIGVILFMMDQFISRAPAQVVADYMKN